MISISAPFSFYLKMGTEQMPAGQLNIGLMTPKPSFNERDRERETERQAKRSKKRARERVGERERNRESKIQRQRETEIEREWVL